jgi:signal transduction histidine kinase
MEIDRLRLLLDISRQMTETRDLSPLLNYAMKVALEMFNAERGFVILLAPDGGLDFRVGREHNGAMLDQPDQQISHTILSRVIENRDNLLIADAINVDSFDDSDSIHTLQIRSVICAPMITQERVIGALYFENRSAAQVFHEDDLEPLRLFATQAAAAIENAQLHEALEARVEERTHELRGANTRLEQMNYQLEAFAHQVAHDLKNPLQGIMGHAALLDDDKHLLPDETMQLSVETIFRMSVKMQEIIDALLMLASIHPEAEIRVEPLDMEAILNSALEELGDMISDSGAQIIRPASWPVVMGHMPWVEAVWRNYIANAIKYGGTPPRVEITYSPAADGLTRFQVTDNGRGISPEDQQRVFNPFVRLHRRDVSGHGLGLAIAQRIVEQLGGQVGVESRPDEGSTFSFTLPNSPA